MPSADHLTEETLYTWLDRENKPEGRRRVAAHLSACPECAARLEAVRALYAGIRDIPTAPLPRDLQEMVLAEIRPESDPVLNPASPYLPLAALLQFGAAVAILVLAAIQFGAEFDGVAAALLEMPETWFGFVAGWAKAIEVFLSGWAAVYELIPSAPELTAIDPALVFDVSRSLLPIVIASGLLWLVGNGILIQGLRSRSVE